MKHAILLSLAALAVPALLAAQNPAPAPFSIPATATIATSDGNALHTITATAQIRTCPVAMQAKQGSGSGLVMVRKDHPDDGESLLSSKPGQQIHLILGKMPGADFSHPEQISGASVTVNGLSARNHLDRAFELTGNGSSDLKRTISVKFSTENDGAVSADLNLPGFTSVNSIKLESVDLKDGSTWKLADLKTCIVTPDRVMLIANQ